MEIIRLIFRNWDSNLLFIFYGVISYYLYSTVSVKVKNKNILSLVQVLIVLLFIIVVVAFIIDMFYKYNLYTQGALI